MSVPPRAPSALRALASGVWGQPYVLLVLTMALWSANMVLARGMSDHIPPVALAQMRWSLAFALLLPFTAGLVRQDWPAIRARWGTLTFLGILAISAYNTFVYVGLGSTSAINASILSSLFPIVIAAVGFVLYRDRLTPAQATGIAVSCAGAFVILSQGRLDIIASFRLNPGDLWILTAQLAYAVYTVKLRDRPAIHPLAFLTIIVGAGQLFLIPFTLLEGAVTGRSVVLDAPTLATAAFVAIFPSIVAYICFNRGVALLGSNRTGPFFHLVPIFGSALAIVFLGEAVAPHHVVGWLLILAGIAAAQRGRRPSPGAAALRR